MPSNPVKKPDEAVRKLPPHPATVMQPKRPFGGGAERPPHPATVVQTKRPSGSAQIPPHPATVATGARPLSPDSGTAQRMNNLPQADYSTTTWSKLQGKANTYGIEDDMMKWLKIACAIGMPAPDLGHGSKKGGSDKKQSGITKTFVDQMKRIMYAWHDFDKLGKAWTMYQVAANLAWSNI